MSKALFNALKLKNGTDLDTLVYEMKLNCNQSIAFYTDLSRYSDESMIRSTALKMAENFSPTAYRVLSEHLKGKNVSRMLKETNNYDNEDYYDNEDEYYNTEDDYDEDDDWGLPADEIDVYPYGGTKYKNYRTKDLMRLKKELFDEIINMGPNSIGVGLRLRRTNKVFSGYSKTESYNMLADECIDNDFTKEELKPYIDFGYREGQYNIDWNGEELDETVYQAKYNRGQMVSVDGEDYVVNRVHFADDTLDFFYRLAKPNTDEFIYETEENITPLNNLWSGEELDEGYGFSSGYHKLIDYNTVAIVEIPKEWYEYENEEGEEEYDNSWFEMLLKDFEIKNYHSSVEFVNMMDADRDNILCPINMNKSLWSDIVTWDIPESNEYSNAVILRLQAMGIDGVGYKPIYEIESYPYYSDDGSTVIDITQANGESETVSIDVARRFFARKLWEDIQLYVKYMQKTLDEHDSSPKLTVKMLEDSTLLRAIKSEMEYYKIDWDGEELDESANGNQDDKKAEVCNELLSKFEDILSSDDDYVICSRFMQYYNDIDKGQKFPNDNEFNKIFKEIDFIESDISYAVNDASYSDLYAVYSDSNEIDVEATYKAIKSKHLDYLIYNDIKDIDNTDEDTDILNNDFSKIEGTIEKFKEKCIDYIQRYPSEDIWSGDENEEILIDNYNSEKVNMVKNILNCLVKLESDITREWMIKLYESVNSFDTMIGWRSDWFNKLILQDFYDFLRQLAYDIVYKLDIYTQYNQDFDNDASIENVWNNPVDEVLSSVGADVREIVDKIESVYHDLNKMADKTSRSNKNTNYDINWSGEELDESVEDKNEGRDNISKILDIFESKILAYENVDDICGEFFHNVPDIDYYLNKTENAKELDSELWEIESRIRDIIDDAYSMETFAVYNDDYDNVDVDETRENIDNHSRKYLIDEFSDVIEDYGVSGYSSDIDDCISNMKNDIEDYIEKYKDNVDLEKESTLWDGEELDESVEDNVEDNEEPNETKEQSDPELSKLITTMWDMIDNANNIDILKGIVDSINAKLPMATNTSQTNELSELKVKAETKIASLKSIKTVEESYRRNRKIYKKLSK